MNDTPPASIALVFAPADHAGVADDGDAGELAGGHELPDHREHRLRSGPVALEGADHERDPVLAGEQADRDLRLQAPLPGEPRLAEPVALAGLEAERGNVAEHQACRAEPGVRGAGRRQPLPPFLQRAGGQPTVKRGIRHRAGTCFPEHPQAVLLARRLDDPRQHQMPEYLLPARGVLQAHDPAGTLDGAGQVTHPGRGDRQRASRSPALRAGAEFRLPGRQPLPRRRLQRLQLSLLVRRADVPDVPRPAPRRPHDLHRRRPRDGLHRANLSHPTRQRAAAVP